MNVSGQRSDGVAMSTCASESRIPNFDANCADVIVFAPVVGLVTVTVAIEFCSPLLFNASRPSSGLALFAVRSDSAMESAYFQS